MVILRNILLVSLSGWIKIKNVNRRKKRNNSTQKLRFFWTSCVIKGDCVCSLQLGSCEYFSLNLEVNIYSTFRLDENVLFFICRILFQFYFLVPTGVTHPPVSPLLKPAFFVVHMTVFFWDKKKVCSVIFFAWYVVVSDCIFLAN